MESAMARPYSAVEVGTATCCSLTIPRGTILLVDEAFVRDVIDEVLQSAGYQVLKTENATEALQKYASYRGKLHLLLTDVVMPGENGRDLARKLRNQCPGMRTIFMSGYGESAALLGAERDANVFLSLQAVFSAGSVTEDRGSAGTTA
jgi:CheY-like chemotaxis protein